MKDIKKLAFFFFDQLQRRRWTALIVAWTVCVTGWFVVALIPNRYVSEARFHVDTTSLLTPLLKGISVNSDDQSRDRQVAMMQRTLTSRPNLLKVLQMTDLDKTARSEVATQDLITSLESRISIKSQGANLFLVEFADNSPEMAKNVIQALLTIFVESSMGDKREDIKNAQSFIDTQIDEYESQLKAAEQRLADFKIQNMLFLSSNSQTFAVRMENSQTNLKNAQFEYDDATTLRNRLQQQLNSTPQYLSIDSAPQIMLGNGTVGGSRLQRIQVLQSRLDDLRLQLTDKHPDVVSTQQALTRMLEEQRDDRTNPNSNNRSGSDAFRSQIPNDLHSQLSLRLAEADGRASTAKRKLLEAQSDFNTLQTRTSEAPRIEAEFTNLNRDYDVMRSSYDALLQRRESARIAAAADSTAEPIQFRMVAAPELPARPSGPNRKLLNTLVLFLGLGAGCGFVILLTQIDDRVTATEDLALFADSKVLGCVSSLVIESREILPKPRVSNFGYAAAGLAGVFALVVVTQPNFSALTHLTMRLSS